MHKGTYFLSYFSILFLTLLNINCIYGQDLDYELGAIQIDTEFSSTSNLQVGGGKLYFIRENRLWASNGSQSYSVMPDRQMTELKIFGEVEDKVLFGIRNNGIGIWSSDGTPEGTQEILRGNAAFLPSTIEMTNFKGKLWFFLDDGSNGLELWQSDGTATGTKMAFESLPGLGTIFNRGDISIGISFIETNGEFLFFTNYDEQNGVEIWVSDGTLDRTKLLKDLTEGLASSVILSFKRFKDKVIFYSNTRPPTDERIWITDGTSEGTTVIREGNLNFGNSSVFIDGSLVAYDWGDLFLTNGTAEGLELIQEFKDGSVRFSELTQYGNRVAFLYNPESFQGELWITDGTQEGTFSLEEEVDLIDPFHLTQAGDFIFFTAKVDFFNKLGVTNGTIAGTRILPFTFQELRFPKDIVLYRGKLYFIAESDKYGETIHFLDFNTPPAISGKIYHDANENRQLEEGERGIPNVGVKAVSATGEETITFSDQEGSYRFFLEEGVYELFPLENNCWVASSEGTTVQIGTAVSLTQDFDFIPINHDLQQLDVKLYSAPTRCGFTVPFWLNVSNIGCSPISGQVALELSDLVTFVDSDIPYDAKADKLITWNFSDLPISNNYQILLKLQIASEEALDSLIQNKIRGWVASDDGTLTLSATSVFESTIRCAIDPNDKQVLPARFDPEENNYTLITEELFYNIRFQNTGNDTAFTVRIVDTLSALLDINSFELLAASHPIRITISQGNVLEFVFDNILLPDSTTNETASHGFLNFKIKPLSGTQDFSKVENEVGIYFDFNNPIITNSVKNTLVTSLDKDTDGYFFWMDCDDNDPSINPNGIEISNNGVDENCDGIDLTTSIYELVDDNSIQIYPNPITTEVLVELEHPINITLFLTTLEGKPIIEIKQTERLERIDMSNLANGFYFLSIFVEEEKKYFVKRLVKFAP